MKVIEVRKIRKKNKNYGDEVGERSYGSITMFKKMSEVQDKSRRKRLD